VVNAAARVAAGLLGPVPVRSRPVRARQARARARQARARACARLASAPRSGLPCACARPARFAPARFAPASFAPASLAPARFAPGRAARPAMCRNARFIQLSDLRPRQRLNCGLGFNSVDGPPLSLYKQQVSIHGLRDLLAELSAAQYGMNIPDCSNEVRPFPGWFDFRPCSSALFGLSNSAPGRTISVG